MFLILYSGISCVGYLTFFLLSKYNSKFQNAICPANYIKGYYNIHELVSYTISTIHASIIALGASYFLLYKANNFILAYHIFDTTCSISIGYFIADIIYVLQNKLSFQNYLIILHHLGIIYYELFALDTTNPVYIPARYYVARALLAEFAVIPLNYGWYLINTNQAGTKRFVITGFITLGTYFCSRIVNLLFIYWNLLQDGYIGYSIVGLPLVIMNVYWFKKLIQKAIKNK